MRGTSSFVLFVGLFALANLLSGCAHTQTRTFDPTASADRAAVNERASRGGASIVLMSGERIWTETLCLDASEASWVDVTTVEPRSMALADM